MLKRLLAGWLGLVVLVVCSLAGAEPAHYKIVTGPERGTYIQIGNDLSKWVAQPVGIDLEVVASKGSAENVQRMRFEPGVKLALVQSDVYQAFIDMANSGNPDAGTTIRPLRLIMPLYDEEINVVVRADSPLKTLADIKDKTISVGLLGSGTAQSATTLYRLMFGQPIPEQNVVHLSNEDALAALIVKKIDVAIIVVGQPAKLFNDMKPDLLSQLRLLPVDPNAPETNPREADLLSDYDPPKQLPRLVEGRRAGSDRQSVSGHLRLRLARHSQQSESFRRLVVRELRQSAGAWPSEMETGEARIADARSWVEVLRSGREASARVSREPQRGDERGGRATRAETAHALLGRRTDASAVQITL
ncbi:TRAP transporter TAXI family solute receptor [Paraburkholderia sp. Clong3]